MRKRIKGEFIEESNEIIVGIKKEVPIITIKPRNNDSRIGIIFLNGLNGTISMVSYFNFDVFNDKHLFSFDNRAQGRNFNYASSNYKKYVNDAKLTIDFIINKNPNIEKWFLIGESWGGALCSLLSQKSLNNKIKGLFYWNVPCKIVNTNPRKGLNAFIVNLKVATTFFIRKSFKIDNPPNKSSTNNKMLLKLIEMNSEKRINTGPIIACWRSFKPAWKKIINDQNNINFIYVQSHDDSMKDEKVVNLFEQKNPKKLIRIDKGTHILSFDIDKDEELFNYLDSFIKETLKKQ